jgi:hypothetical protein
LFTPTELNHKIAIIELQIILLCFRSQNLEKRIYGLLQFNEKVSEALTNEFNAR